MSRRRPVIAVLVLVAACSPAASLTPTGSHSTIPWPAAPSTIAIPSPTAARPSAIVGTWRRRQSCEELMAAFRSAGLLEAHLDWAEALCAETKLPTEHSHVFTDDGQFGSHDQDGQQVDEGDYEEATPGTLSFPSHAREFGYDGEIAVEYRVEGDAVTFDVRVPAACTGPCGLAYFWALSAFASGPWTSTALEARSGRPALVDGEAAACIPVCGVGRVAGGRLPVGRYQTEWFFGGYMTIETDGTWERGEDSNGELSVPLPAPAGGPAYLLAFVLDPVLVVDDVIQEDVPRRADAYVEWLSAQPHLIVSAPIETSIGTVPATAVDIRLGPNAPSQYDDCPPDPCVAFIKVEAFDHSDGILGDDIYRFYFADITYSGTDHMLAVKVEGRDAADLGAALLLVEPLLATVIVPASPAPT